MSSLLPLIVLSIALLHCVHAAAPKCRQGAQAYTSDGTPDGPPLHAINDIECDDGKCALVLERSNSGKFIVLFLCETNIMEIVEMPKYDHGCKREHKLTCVCDPKTDSICNLPENMFDPNGDKAHTYRIQLASKMGFIARDGAGKGYFKLGLLKCEKWTVTFDYTGGVTDENVKRVENCNKMCYTTASHNTVDKTYNIESDCYTHDRPAQIVEYEQNDSLNNALTVYCLANSENSCNTVKAMFDPKGDSDLQDRARDLKSKVGLAVQSSIKDGKIFVDFKWSNCIEFHYEQSAEGVQKMHTKKTIHCKSGVCILKLERLDKKISVDTGCGDDGLPIPTVPKCKTILEEERSTCRCAADKEPCNTISALYNPSLNIEGQKKRFHNLRYIGINATFDSAGEGKFIYEEDFGKTTTEATITVSGETTVPLPPTARPPSDLPEDDPYYEELLGAGSGLSLTIAVLFSILRLI